jgi:hypothetical protein
MEPGEALSAASQDSGALAGFAGVVDSSERTIWIADAGRDGKRFVLRANETLTAFVEIESAIRATKYSSDR